MTALILLLGLVVVVESARQTGRFKALASRRAHIHHYIPKAMGVLIITTQVSELLKVVEHISIVNIAAAVFLLVITLASKAGSEEEAEA